MNEDYICITGIYYYDLDEEEVIPLKEYDVISKITDEVYDMVAYEEGMVVYAYCNLHGLWKKEL